MTYSDPIRSRDEIFKKTVDILQEKYEVKPLYDGFFFYIDLWNVNLRLPIICQLTEEDIILSAILVWSGKDEEWDEGTKNVYGSVAEKLNFQLIEQDCRYSLVKTLRHEIFGDCVSASQIIEYTHISDVGLLAEINKSVNILKLLCSKFHNYWENKEYKREYKTESTNGCYIATCVYGSYDCPQVWTLRRYRDNTLASTWYGRAFIKTYYAISPTLVKWFGHTIWFRKMWVGLLDKMVDNLQTNGVESTPYKDKEW